MLIIVLLIPLIQGATFVIDPAKNAVWHNEKGLFFLRLGNYYGAIEEFRLAIALNHDTQASATFYNNLGSTYQKLGVPKAAIDCYQRAIRLNPYFFPYYYNLIDSYNSQKQINTLINKNKQAITKNKSDSKAYLALGLIYKKQKNKQEAIKYLSEFRRLEPDLDVTRQVDTMLRELRK